MDDSEAKNITEYRKTVCSITVQPNLPTRKTHSTCDDCVYKNGLKRIDIPSYCANLKEVVMKHYWVRDLVEVRKYNGELRYGTKEVIEREIERLTKCLEE